MFCEFTNKTKQLSFSVLMLAIVAFFIAQPLKANEVSAVQSENTMPASELDLVTLELQLQDLQAERSDLAEQYQMLSGNRLLHRVLQEQRAALPNVELQNFQEQLSELRLEIFYLQRQLREASSAERVAELTQQEQQLQQQVDLLVDYTRVQQQMHAEVRAFAVELEEYLFWTPSNPRMNTAWWLTVPQLLVAQQQRMSIAFTGMLRNIDFRPSWSAILLMVALILALWRRQKFGRLLHEQQVALQENGVPCSTWGVSRALAKMAVYVSPVSLTLLLIGQFIGKDESIQHLNASAVFTALAFAWFMVSFLAKILQPAGFAETYFRWPSEHCVYLRRYIHMLAFALLPVTFVLAFASQQTNLFSLDVVGPISLLIAAIYITGITVWLFRALPQLNNSVVAHRSIGAAILLLPATLIWMVISGYYYTALQLSGYYLATFYVFSIWIIAEASIRTGILFSSRRLKQQRDEEISQLSAENGFVVTDIESVPQPDAPPLDYADIEKAELQSIRLARFFLLVVFSFVLLWVWSEALHALDYLNSQYIWDSEQGLSMLPISIGGILSAVFITFLSVVLIRNLPGLLEVLVLSRLKLQMGTAYAITSLTNYVLVSIAIITVLAILGVKWSQLQWLAAGLTVGLGFGLQEIFANFISGLILFFERPVRVGDIVTLNNLSGRVSKIKIRATVITDFDRRDIVVPNRSFITGQFVNWSLSNTITRITVKVGVAYGSDLTKTREILLDIAEQEPRALADPPPQVLFLTFGGSTLDHELRVHVGSLSDRNPAIDAINREIDRRFKEAEIEIAFNQIDVHFRNELGVERKVQRLGPKS